MQRFLPPLAATLLLTTLLLPAACAPRISLFSGASDPLEEYTLLQRRHMDTVAELNAVENLIAMPVSRV